MMLWIIIRIFYSAVTFNLSGMTQTYSLSPTRVSEPSETFGNLSESVNLMCHLGVCKPRSHVNPFRG